MNSGHFTWTPVDIAGGYNERCATSDNYFKSGKVYHRDGIVTEWRNYAIIKTDEREFRAPIIMEEG